MAKSVLELAVGTGQWDAGLKKAKSALDNFIQSQGGLQSALGKDSASMQKFVQMMGQADSTAKTAKGQMNDYKSTIEQLTMQYNRMTDAQKKTIGHDYLQSIEQLKQKYQSVNHEIQQMNKSLNNTPSTNIKDGGGGLFGGGKLDGMLQVFGGNLMTKGASMLAGLASEMGDMVQQGIELAKQGEGIRIAFERLGRGDILDGLREATHGTVTDIELMKAAVKFNDFKLPVEELGTMLAFAQQKAKDTGQSVDYMVDSIVTGLGRKSLMILDNLGLSATEVKERMKETGDMTKAVGEIIREQMAKAGDYVETAADRAAQANVSLQNKMEELGRKFAPVEEASNQLWTSMKIGILDIIGGPLATLLNQLTEAGRLKNALNNLNGEPGSGNTKVDQQVKKLNVIKKAGGSDYIFNSTLNGMMEDYNRQIAALDAKIKETKKLSPDQQASKFVRDEVQKMSEQMKALGMMRDQLAAGAKELSKPVKIDIQTDNAIRSVDELKVKLAELQAQRKKVKAGSDEAKRLDTEIRQVKADIKLQNPNALKTTHTTTPQEKAAEMVANAERTYAETLQKSAIRMEVGLDSTIEGKKKELSAQERLFDAYNDAYATYKDPKYKDAASEAANKIKSLAGEVKSMEDAVAKSKVKWEQGDSGFNTKTMQAWMQGRQGDLSKADYGTKEYKDIMGNIADMKAVKTMLETSIKAGIDAAEVDITPLWEKLFNEQLPEGSIATVSDALTKVYEEAFDGIDISDGTIQGLIDKINEKLKEKGLDPIKIDLTTGDVKSGDTSANKNQYLRQNADGKMEAKANELLGGIAGGISQIAGGLEMLGVEIPEELQSVLNGMMGISQILTGIATTILAIEAIAGADAIIPFARGGVVPHAATGYFVGGNRRSGDTTPIMANAGELVLNESSQNSLATSILQARGLIESINMLYGIGNPMLSMQTQSALGGQMRDGGLSTLKLEAYVKGEQLHLVHNRFLRRSGQGEIVTWK